MNKSDINLINLTKFPVGKIALVTEIRGDESIINKLETMGITNGSHIKKIGKSFLHGPIIIEKDSTKLAVGYNMAKTIIVSQLD